MRTVQKTVDDFVTEIQERTLPFNRMRTSQKFTLMTNQYLREISGSDPVPKGRKKYQQLKKLPVLLWLTNAYVQTVLRRNNPEKAEKLLNRGKELHARGVNLLLKANPNHEYFSLRKLHSLTSL